MKENKFGIITLANQNDYFKAIGLALAIKITHGDIPVSVICKKELEDKLADYFETVIIERSDLRGFEHKLFLDIYTPYSETLFLDADMLVFKDTREICKKWSQYPYAAQGAYSTEGKSSFGLDTGLVLDRINKPRLTNISGAGHAYFRTPDCKDLFEDARRVMHDYGSYEGKDIRFADEDVMNIALTMHGIPPQSGNSFMGMPCHARKGTMSMDVLARECRYYDEIGGWTRPHVMHFARRQHPFLYARELTKLYRRQRVKIGIHRLWIEAIVNKIKTDIVWDTKTNLKNKLTRLNMLPLR